MPRPATRPHNPLLECKQCHEPVIKTADAEFECVECGWQPVADSLLS
ncbi:hypothetical protein HISP_14840 [Haloarcula hispanica N601]|uniref:Viral late gene transcription factor 3 zinc ribbon domain-containing protein n=1 Tax=Haloarcula hispanica N601 TaxID=1417673 RepID=V5TQJ4_HALHI|nr:hypothetical protein HISP_14840 [Haloarcula hispanica N601]